MLTVVGETVQVGRQRMSTKSRRRKRGRSVFERSCVGSSCMVGWGQCVVGVVSKVYME